VRSSHRRKQPDRRIINTAPLCEAASSRKRSGMALGSHSSTCHPRDYPQKELNIPAFAFPAEDGHHLPTPEGSKAKLQESVQNRIRKLIKLCPSGAHTCAWPLFAVVTLILTP